MTSHANCAHEATKAGRAACRKANGHVPTTRQGAFTAPRKAAKGGPKSLAEANEVGNIDASTLDDRIRDAKRRPKAGPVKVTKA